MERKNLILLILIVILGAVLRFVFLTNSPPSLNWDEVSHGYNAYSILKTGMDQWGQKLPLLNFRAYGDYPTTLNLYLTIPFLVIFGLTEFALRFPHAFFGTVTIISIYFLTLGLTKKNNLSLLATFLAAIGPWYVFTSRFVLQSNLSVFLLITAATFFVNREKNKWFLPMSFFFLTFTLFSYHTTRIFSPLFLLGLMIIFRQEIKNKVVYVLVGLFLVFSTFILISPNASARGNVLFIIDQGAVNRIIESRNSSKLPSFLTRLVYNRPVYFAKAFSKNYINYFSPKFLFLSGGTQYQFSVPGYGLIYPVSLPFFYIGLILLVIKSIKSKNYRLLLLWLILSPIPAALTNEYYTVLRTTAILPIPEILIAMGLFFVLDKLPKKFRLFAVIIYIFILVFSAENYFYNYFTSYRKDYSWSWQYGYKEVVSFIKDNYNNYDNVIVTKKYGEPHEYLLFYLKYDPIKYLNDTTKIAFAQSNWYWVDSYDKFYFVNDWQVSDLITESEIKIDCSKKKCLLVTSPNNYPNGWVRINTVNFLDGSPAFEMYENN